MTNIHLKIAAVRRLRHLSQEGAARICHISIRTYQRLESGAGSPRLGDLDNLASGFACSVNDLLYFDLEKNCFPLCSIREQELERECVRLKKQLQDLQNPESVYPQRARASEIATPGGAWREREQVGLWGQII